MPTDVDRDLATLEAERSRLHDALREVGDFRRGSLNEAWRRCGKERCRCAAPDHPGHGPMHLLTRSVRGRTVTRAVPEGPELDKVRREVASYRRFRSLVEDIVEVSGAICEARPVSPLAQERPEGDGAGAETGGPSGTSEPSSPRR